MWSVISPILGTGKVPGCTALLQKPVAGFFYLIESFLMKRGCLLKKAVFFK
jgi:hypothetical protein